jgi:hypothetical protein
LGDHPQQQTMCGMTTSGKGGQPCRRCHVAHANLGRLYALAVQRNGANPPCRPRKAKTTERLMKAAYESWVPGASNTASKLELRKLGFLVPPARLAFHAYPWGDRASGVHAHAPQDWLHHSECGWGSKGRPNRR